VKGLAEESGDERFAWDSYRRLLQMFGKTVLDIPGEVFSEALDTAKTVNGVTSDLDLVVDDLTALVDVFKGAVRKHSGQDFPQRPRE
jgi:pyruvate,orthophosphate dikinase